MKINNPFIRYTGFGNPTKNDIIISDESFYITSIAEGLVLYEGEIIKYEIDYKLIRQLLLNMKDGEKYSPEYVIKYYRDEK